MTEWAIDIKGLRVWSGTRHILAIDDLMIPQGDLVGVLGPNGSGKTTLLRCLMGLQRHASGTVQVLGKQVLSARASVRVGVRRRIGYVPQLLPARSETPLTVSDVVSLGISSASGFFKSFSSEDRRVVETWLDRLGLTSLADRGYGEISGGEQRKTLIARAMVRNPEIMLLDEPTANLDLAWREQIVSLIGELHHRYKMTVLQVCHCLEDLPPSISQVVLFQAGTLIGQGTPQEVLTEQMVERFYGTGLSLWQQGGRWAVIPASKGDTCLT